MAIQIESAAFPFRCTDCDGSGELIDGRGEPYPCDRCSGSGVAPCDFCGEYPASDVSLDGRSLVCRTCLQTEARERTRARGPVRHLSLHTRVST